jgi:peptidoglycan-N-acetylglucosamine deacetylase
MRSSGPRLDRPSAVATAIAFGVVAAFGPALWPPPVPQPPPAPVAAPAPPPFVASTTVVNEVPQDPGAAPTVVLTFDDGPDPRWTPRILDVLARHGAVATFCMVGEKAAAHPDLVRAVAAAGMRLCDHSRTHDEGLTTRPTDRMTEEVVDTQHALADAAGAAVTYFRAPGGTWSPPLQQLAADSRMQPLGWSVDPRDWKRPGADAVVAAVQKHVRPGSIVLMHDGGGRRDQTVAALDRLLPWLTDHGYHFGFPTP